MTSRGGSNSIRIISDDIRNCGYHLTVVQQGTVPRFAYTIGLKQSIGFELILAGASVFLLDDLINIISIANNTYPMQASLDRPTIETGEYGKFTLSSSHASWVQMLMLGAIDFFGDTNIVTYQLRPDPEHMTIDVPDLSLAWNPKREPAWRWLRDPWDLPIPSTSTATTNLAALRGARITEASRWESDEWDLFAGPGPDTPRDEIRVVPIGTLLAVDVTLQPVLSLSIGKSLWRDTEKNEWNEW